MESPATVIIQPKKTRGRRKKIVNTPTLVVQHGTFTVSFG